MIVLMETYEEDPADRLIVRFYRSDEDGTGELHVSAATRGFAGTASAWFDVESLGEFAASLAKYPLPDDLSISLSGGGTPLSGPRKNHYWEQVGLIFHPVGGKGQVGVRIHLQGRDDVPGQEVRMELLTTYERLRLFSGHVVRMLNGEFNEAELGGEVLW
jgi:hypothetical protein